MVISSSMINAWAVTFPFNFVRDVAGGARREAIRRPRRGCADLDYARLQQHLHGQALSQIRDDLVAIRRCFITRTDFAAETHVVLRSGKDEAAFSSKSVPIPPGTPDVACAAEDASGRTG